MIAVRLAALDADRPLPQRYWAGLTGDERARAGRFRRAGDRDQFVAARGLLADALAELFGVAGARLVATDGPKPMLVGEGVPAGLDVNLSHADGMVGCVFGLDLQVGIDVERHDRGIDTAGLAAHFAAEEQHGAHSGQALSLWTLKEVVAKAVGLGLALGIADFACAVDPPRLLRGPAVLGPPAQWRLHGWDEPSHRVAIAVSSGLNLAIRKCALV